MPTIKAPAFSDEFEFASYFDLAQGVCTFDSAPFADYLAAVDALPWDREVRGGLDYSQGTYVFKAADYFCFRQMVAMSNLPHVDGRYAETGSTPSILLHSTSGDYPFGVSSLLAIPAASENKELAWEFLKFVVNTQEFPEKVTPYYDPQVGMQLSNLYLSCIPLNRENFFRLGESLGWGERLLEQFDRYNQKLNARNPHHLRAERRLGTGAGKLPHQPPDHRRGVRPANAGACGDLFEGIKGGSKNEFRHNS